MYVAEDSETSFTSRDIVPQGSGSHLIVCERRPRDSDVLCTAPYRSITLLLRMGGLFYSWMVGRGWSWVLVYVLPSSLLSYLSSTLIFHLP
jgi:hypothetical protein